MEQQYPLYAWKFSDILLFLQNLLDPTAGACRDRMNRLGAGAAVAANTSAEVSDNGTAVGRTRNEQHSSAGTVEALQQRMLLHLHKAV